MVSPHNIEATVTEAGLALSGVAWIVKNVAADCIDMWYELKERRAALKYKEETFKRYPRRFSLKSVKKAGR